MKKCLYMPTVEMEKCTKKDATLGLKCLLTMLSFQMVHAPGEKNKFFFNLLFFGGNEQNIGWYLSY